MLFLRTFGALEVENGNSRPTGAALHPSRLAVIAAIASSGDLGISRDTLYALFWPESTVHRARGSLKQALFALRRDLGCEQLTTGRAVLKLNASTLSADVVQFVDAYKNHDHLTLVTVYRGEFLGGIRIRGSPEFDEWADKQRAIFSSCYRKSLEHLATHAEGIESKNDALRWWKQLADADPYSAVTAVRYMHALIALGKREEAIGYGLLHSQRVAADLDAEPEPEVVELISKLRSCSFVPVPRASIERQPPVPAHVPPGFTENVLRRTRLSRRISRTLWAAVVPVTVAGAMIPLVDGTTSPSTGPSVQGIQVEKFVLIPQNDTSLEAVDDISASLESELKGAGFTPLSDPLDNSDEREAKSTRNETTIVGSVSHEGDRIVFRAAVRDGPTGAIVSAIAPIRVSREHIGRGRTILSREIFAALGTPFEPSLFPLLTRPELPRGDSAYGRYLLGLHLAGYKKLRLSAASSAFNAAYGADTLFPTALLAEAFAYRSRDSLWVVTPLLSRLNRQRTRLSHLNRIALSYLIYEANGDFDSKLEIARKGSDLAPQSAWSLEAARLSIDAGQNVEAETYLERYSKGLNWRTPSAATADLDFLRIEAAHRADDRDRERFAIKQALGSADTTFQVEYALARRLILDGKFQELKQVFDRVLRSHRAEYDELSTRLLSELRCHTGNHRSLASTGALGLLPDSLHNTASRARSEAYNATERGAWWYASSRFRAVLDSFPRAATLQDSARASWVEANMIDTKFADLLIADLRQRNAYRGDGSAEYWLAAALVRRGRVNEALPLINIARKKGLPSLRSGHSLSPDIELLRHEGLVSTVASCSRN